MTESRKLQGELQRIKPELIYLRETKQFGGFRFTSLSDRAFNIFLHLLISELGPIAVSTAASETAFEMGLSTATAARYLEKHLTRRAHFSISKYGLVECRDCSIGMWETEPQLKRPGEARASESLPRSPS